MANENREYKDSVFCDLFYNDPEAKRNLLELYNALFGTQYTDPEIVQLIRLEDVLFKNLKNDVAFTVNHQRIVLSEHQSTINPNMPLRNLMYIAREYERIVPVRKRYQKNLIELPTPVFYTFYNGTDDYPTEQELLLSSAFTDKKNPALELKVKIININPDKKHDLLDKCTVLKEYSEFVEITRKYKKDKASLADAIQECINRGILADYLRRKRSEVVNMLMAEYDYEMDIAVQREEAAQEAAQKALQRGEFKKLINQIIKKLKKGYTIVQIADDLEETGENIQSLVDIALKYAPEYDENKILDEVFKLPENKNG